MPPETLDPPTLLGGDSTSHGEDHVARVPALTILWHPDVGRVGECAVLRGQRVEVSRLEPLFQVRSAKKEGGSPSPIRTSALERRPLPSPRPAMALRSRPSAPTLA